MTEYISKNGDMLDAICFVHYGRENAIVAVLLANPGLSDQPEVLPSGVRITLPDLPEAAVTTLISLWD